MAYTPDMETNLRFSSGFATSRAKFAMDRKTVGEPPYFWRV